MAAMEDDGPFKEEETVAAAATTKSHSRTLALTLVSAGMGNSLSAVCTNFADIIKVRQQLQQQRTRVSFWSVGTTMLRTEGLRSFANGVTASCLRECTYSSIRMGTYETFRDLFSAVIPASSFGNKLLSGMTSGAIGAAVSTPTDLMKVRMQAPRPTGRPPYPNTFVGFVHVFREGSSRVRADGGAEGIIGGFRSLWRGTTPNVVRAAILTASQLGCYDEAKGQFKRRLGMQEGLGLHFASSFVAGFVCSACSQPVDVIKVRIMSQSKALTGSLQSLGNLLRNEGPLALYKGFAACWLRLGLHSVISLILFERFRAVLGVKPL